MERAEAELTTSARRGPAASEANFMSACITKPPPMITARISTLFPSEKAA